MGQIFPTKDFASIESLFFTRDRRQELQTNFSRAAAWIYSARWNEHGGEQVAQSRRNGSLDFGNHGPGYNPKFVALTKLLDCRLERSGRDVASRNGITRTGSNISHGARNPLEFREHPPPIFALPRTFNGEITLDFD